MSRLVSPRSFILHPILHLNMKDQGDTSLLQYTDENRLLNTLI